MRGAYCSRNYVPPRFPPDATRQQGSYYYMFTKAHLVTARSPGSTHTIIGTPTSLSWLPNVKTNSPLHVLQSIMHECVCMYIVVFYLFVLSVHIMSVLVCSFVLISNPWTCHRIQVTEWFRRHWESLSIVLPISQISLHFDRMPCCHKCPLLPLHHELSHRTPCFSNTLVNQK